MNSYPEELIDEFEDFVHRQMQEHDIPGLSVAVADAGECLYAEGFGSRNLEDDLPATADTVYGMASVTKSFTALAVLILEEEGLLSVGEPVVKYLPEFQPADELFNKSVNIHHLLTHTSGLAPTAALRYCMVRSIKGDPIVELLKEKGKWEQWTDREPIDTYAELLHFLNDSDMQMLGRPGQQLSYSNDAYALLGTIVERVSGQTFESFVSERILQPLEMNRSFFELERLSELQDVTQLYAKDEDELMTSPKWQNAPAMVGAGFLRSTVTDMVKYGQMYLRRGLDSDGNQLISGGTISRMSAGIFPCGRKVSYGYGLRTRPGYHGVTLVEHGGSLKGVSSNFGFIPERGITAMVVANLQGIPASKIWLAAVNLLLGLPIDTRRSVEPEYDAEEQILKRFEGLYKSGEGAEIRVVLDDGQLFAEMEDQRKELRPSGIDSVAIERRGDEAQMKFLTGPDGEVESMFFGLRIIKKVE